MLTELADVFWLVETVVLISYVLDHQSGLLMELMEFSSVLSKTRFNIKMSLPSKLNLYRLVLQHFIETLHTSQTIVLHVIDNIDRSFVPITQTSLSPGVNPRVQAYLWRISGTSIKTNGRNSYKVASFDSFKNFILFFLLVFLTARRVVKLNGLC